MIIYSPLSFKLLYLFCCQWNAVKLRKKREKAKFVMKSYVRIKCPVLKVLCLKRKWTIIYSDVRARDNVKSTYTFTHTQIHVFDIVFNMYIQGGRKWKYSIYSVVQSTSAVACYIVTFKYMRWSKKCSVSESLFFTGHGLSQWRYVMSYNCSFTQLYYLYVSRKCTSHKYTILSHFLSLSFLISFHSFSFLPGCIGEFSFCVLYLTISLTRAQYCIFLGFSISTKQG